MGSRHNKGDSNETALKDMMRAQKHLRREWVLEPSTGYWERLELKDDQLRLILPFLLKVNGNEFSFQVSFLILCFLSQVLSCIH